VNALQGKVAVITGGNSGIGLATAKRFVEEGAYVFITGRRQAQLDKAVADISKNVTAIQSDVSNLADLDRLFKTVEKSKGRIDILFANAGIVEPTPTLAVTPEHYDKTFDINMARAFGRRASRFMRPMAGPRPHCVRLFARGRRNLRAKEFGQT